MTVPRGVNKTAMDTRESQVDVQQFELRSHVSSIGGVTQGNTFGGSAPQEPETTSLEANQGG